MELKVSIIASGLKLLNFQGVTVSNDEFVVATLDGDLLRISLDGTLTRWVNLFRYGIPTGVVNIGGTIGVAVSAQESGYFLMQVTPEGKISSIADLSPFVGAFGEPLGIAARVGYYPYYLVAISTDVVSSAGLVVRVTPSGRVSQLAQLASSPFGIAASADRVIVTQEDGNLLQISPAGKVSAIANLVQAGFGIPLGVTLDRDNCIVTTNMGWLVQVSPDRMSQVVNFLEAGLGNPTTIATGSISYIVATTTGNLVRVSLSENN